MTYNVFGGTLSLTQSINHCRIYPITEFHHVTDDTLQMFKVTGSEVKVTS